MSRYARRTDSNHAQIRDGLRLLGFHVYDWSKAGEGVPDLLIWKGGWWRMVEVKAEGGALTPREQMVSEVCADRYILARTIEDVLEAYRLSSG